MSLINIGLSGMRASNVGLSITAHNVANVNTPGFSRQRVGFGTQITGPNAAGVSVTNIERMSDNYLNQQIYKQNSSWGFNKVSSSYMQRAESLLNHDSSSINTGLDRFYAALAEASTAPQDIAHRQTVISQTKSMVQRFNNLDSQLKTQAKQLDGHLDASITDANTLLASVASLNKTIKDATATGKDVSSLLDTRDDAIRQLSEMMDISTSYHEDGSVSLTLDRGQTLVSDSLASQLQKDPEGKLTLSRGNAQLAIDDNLGGTIGALMNYRDGELQELQQELDVMAYSFANQFNETHASGYDLNDESGKPMFGGVDTVEGAAGRLSMLITDPKDLAFSAQPGEPGNSDNLEAMNDLRNSAVNIDVAALSEEERLTYQTTVERLNGKSIYDNYTGLVGDWAIKTAQLEVDTQSSESLVKQAQGDRDAMAGVNLDEEAANIMQYTQMYQANAKVISTAQQLFDVTMSMFR